VLNQRIEIVCASERELSSMGQKSRRAVQSVLAKRYARVDITLVHTIFDLKALVARRPDVVFLGMKFIPMNPALGLHDPHKIWISQYLDEHGIVHTGSGQLAHELEFHKQLAKQRVLAAGLKTPSFQVIKQGQDLAPGDMALTFPVFIKPTDRGGGAGVDGASMAHNFEQLLSKVQSLAGKLQADALIEEYLPGREFSVALLKDTYSNQFSVMPIELIAPPDSRGARFLSAAVKSADTEYHLEVTDRLIKARITALAINVFHALGARDYGRIDIRLDRQGAPHFLEANLLPSLINGYGNFPKACLLNKGIGYENMILRIVALAMQRIDIIEDERIDLSPVPVPA
jgi:D-alanine-D-alanine ligase